MHSLKPSYFNDVKYWFDNEMKIFFYTLWVLIPAFISAQNINVSNGAVFDGEPYMVIDPNNSHHIVVAWMGYTVGQPLGIKTKVSTNGGASWSSSVILPHGAPTYKSADPSMDFDSNGDLWACYVDYRQAPDSGGIYLVKSTDGGYTWGSFTKAMDGYDDGMEKPIDRPWLSINPVNNHFYITSKPAPWVPAPNRPYLSVSYDMGVNWEAWRYIDTTGFLVGNLIAAPMAAIDCGSDGTMHVVYPTYEPSQFILPGFLHASSINSGVNFNYHPAGYALPGSADTLVKGGYDLQVDPSDPNHLAFCYVFKPSGGDHDIFIIESTNGGLNWSTPVRVNDDTPNNGIVQDLAWCDFDNDGDLVVAWRDRRNGTGTGYVSESEIMGAVLWNDSTNFSSNFYLADSLAAFNAVLYQDGNDFMNVLMQNDTVYTVWGDVRTGILQIWFAKKSLITGVTSVESLVTEQIPQVHFYPNPANEMIKLEVVDLVKTEIFDANGKLMYFSDQTDLNTISIGNYIAGTYIIRFSTKQGVIERKMIKY